MSKIVVGINHTMYRNFQYVICLPLVGNRLCKVNINGKIPTAKFTSFFPPSTFYKFLLLFILPPSNTFTSYQ